MELRPSTEKPLPAAGVIDYIDEICDEFETAWLGGHDPAIEDYLEIVGKESDPELFRELLTTELELRDRQGQLPRRREYLRRFPDYAALIRGTFEALDVAAERAAPPEVEPEPAAPAGLPRRVGPYELLEKIGQGGMGEVYRAIHVKLRRTVAVKILPAELTMTPEAVARFEREIIVAGKVDHPNLVRAHDANDDNGVHYLAMEYVEGIDLAELAAACDPLPIAEACAIVCQAAEGLQNVLEHSLVHRDIKPSNLMLNKSGQVKILDLGLALLSDLSEHKSLTSTFRLMGTLDYMAPEQLENTHRVDIRADIYALGATLYRLLCGQPPLGSIGRDNRIVKIIALSTRKVPAVTKQRPEVPRELAAIVQRLLAKDREKRFAVPADVAAALRPFAAGADLPALYHEAQRDAQGRSPPAASAAAVSPHKAAARREKHLHFSLPVPSPAFAGSLLGCAAVAVFALLFGSRYLHQETSTPSAGAPRSNSWIVAPLRSARDRAALEFTDSGQWLGQFDSAGVALGDVDGDDDLDALVANRAQGPNRIWLNQGDGMFSLDHECQLGSGARSVALGDLDGDKVPDAFLLQSDGFLEVWLNDGRGRFVRGGGSRIGTEGCQVALGDLDGDGDLDAFLANGCWHGDAPNQIWMNNGDARFRDSGARLGNAASCHVALGDLDGDGDLDAYVANIGPNRVWLNNGHGRFRDPGQRLGNFESMGVGLGDLDGDGDLDAMTANSGGVPNRVWLNDGRGNFTDSGQALGYSNSVNLDLGDLDGDGDLDAFVTNSCALANRIWLNDGGGVFTDSGLAIGADWSVDVKLGDLDGDGDLDAFVANSEHRSNRIWLNAGQPQ